MSVTWDDTVSNGEKAPHTWANDMISAIKRRGAKFVVTTDTYGDYYCDGTDDDVQIQEALDALTAGRTFLESVKLRGAFSLSNPLSVPALTFLDTSEAILTLATGTNDNMIVNESNGDTDILIYGGILNGNKTNQTGASSGIVMDGVTRFWIQNVYVHDFYSNGIHVAPTNGRTSERGFITNFAGYNNGTSGVGGNGICLGTAGNANGVHISGFDIRNSRENQISIESGAHVTVTNGLVRDGYENGIYVASTMTYVDLNNIISRGHSTSGVSVVGSYVNAANLTCFANGSAGAAYGGFRIHSAAHDINLSNVNCYDGGGGNQNYGVSIEDTVDHVHINNCNLRGNVDTPLKYTSSGVDITGDGLARTATSVDLSGAAETLLALHTEEPLHLIKATLLYTEASSGDAGVAIKIGKESDDDYYYTGTSEVSKSQWYSNTVTLLKNDVAAGDTVLFKSAGGKVGTGEIMCIIDYLTGA